MALRHERGARLRRAARGRAGLVALACALYLAAGAVTTWPALRDWRTSFLAEGAPGYGEAAPGDHLQTAYNLWLVDHQLARGRAPWLDPYSFQPELEPRPNLQGWLLGVPFGVAAWAFGLVVAWNLLVLASFVGAGGLAAAWLRAFGLSRGAALAGGLAFAIAPYRVAQSTGHLLGFVALLLPLALLGVERSRRGSRGGALVAAAALTAIPLSGQVHLALGAIPLVVLYGLVRLPARPARLAVVAAALAAVAAGILVRQVAIVGTLAGGGRTLEAVDLYSAEWSDLVARGADRATEELVFVGWATPLLAGIGAVLLVREGRHRLAALLSAGALVPILLALGTNFPLYRPLWHAFPPFRYPRVPERLMPIACLMLAALVAVAVSRARWRLVPALAVLVLALDLHTSVFRASAADPGNRAYSALDASETRLLELPVYLPDRALGSVYLYYDVQARVERPLGYSTLAPLRADGLARRLRPLSCGDWSGGLDRLLRTLGVRSVAVHGGRYRSGVLVAARCAGQARAGLRRHGYTRVAAGGVIEVWQRRAKAPLAVPTSGRAGLPGRPSALTGRHEPDSPIPPS